GGNALKFYASVRLDVRRIGAIKEAGPPGKDMVVVGNRTRVKVVKNKLAAPFREVEFDILYGQGISRSGEIIDMAADLNLVQKSGAWFSLDGERIGQGRDNARTYLEQHPAMLEKLAQKILATSGIARGEAAPAAAPAASTEGKPSGKGEADGARPTPNGSPKPKQPTPARPS
ncbi:MAG TPA: DNA recombination/repair protein RecA, partial [Polyangiaceae bacterium]|nr:DNA recombination/repair protein RecA [Polyangiaceae bacterium]